MSAYAADSSGLADVLDALRIRSGALFGHPHASFEPLAFFDRPFSTVVRLRIAPPAGSPLYAFTKIYKARVWQPYETPRTAAEVVEQEFAATARLYAALAGRPGFASPRPIASFPEHGAIVTGELEGTPLDRALRRPRRGSTPLLQSIATRIAAWLRAYQSSQGDEARGCWNAAENRAYLDDRLRHITPGFLPDASRREALALFDRLAADVTGSEPLVAIHADLCPGNILVMPGGGVAVLDFATAQQGTRFHDIAHLYLHLELARRRVRRRVDLGAMQDALIAGFDRASSVSHPLFRLMLLQHIVCHVTQLADSAGWRPRAAVRALARWRWNMCLGMPAMSGRNEVCDAA